MDSAFFTQQQAADLIGVPRHVFRYHLAVGNFKARGYRRGLQRRLTWDDIRAACKFFGRQVPEGERAEVGN